MSLDVLVINLLSAKKAEDVARAKRVEIEEAIAALIPGPEEGQKTVKLDSGASVTVKRGFNYKANFEAIDAVRHRHHSSATLASGSWNFYGLDRKRLHPVWCMEHRPQTPMGIPIHHNRWMLLDC